MNITAQLGTYKWHRGSCTNTFYNYYSPPPPRCHDMLMHKTLSFSGLGSCFSYKEIPGQRLQPWHFYTLGNTSGMHSVPLHSLRTSQTVIVPLLMEWLSSEVQQLASAWLNCFWFSSFTPSSDNTREVRGGLASTELAPAFGELLAERV